MSEVGEQKVLATAVTIYDRAIERWRERIGWANAVYEICANWWCKKELTLSILSMWQVGQSNGWANATTTCQMNAWDVGRQNKWSLATSDSIVAWVNWRDIRITPHPPMQLTCEKWWHRDKWAIAASVCIVNMFELNRAKRVLWRHRRPGCKYVTSASGSRRHRLCCECLRGTKKKMSWSR